MIRLWVSLESADALAKIVRISEEIKFPLLLGKIAHRLGVRHSTKQEREEWHLLLSGDVLIGDSQEIDDGDNLVLMLNTQPAKAKPEVDKESNKSFLLKDKCVSRRIAKAFDKKVRHFGAIDRCNDDDSLMRETMRNFMNPIFARCWNCAKKGVRF
jgi:hypothetical protein